MYTSRMDEYMHDKYVMFENREWGICMEKLLMCGIGRNRQAYMERHNRGLEYHRAEWNWSVMGRVDN